MNNLSMKLSETKLPEIIAPDLLNLDIRYVQTNQGKFKETKSKNTCCICGKNFWIQGNAFLEGFKVMDSRAYKSNVTPNYIQNPSFLKECHWDCKQELDNQLNNNTFSV